MKRIFFDSGCGECGSESQNSYNNSLKGPQGPPGKQGIQGTPGKNSVLVGSQTDGTTDSGSTDDAIGGTTIADLATLGFDATAKPTIRTIVDTSDTNNTKYFIRESNSWLNFLTAKLKNGLQQAGTVIGQIQIWSGSAWVASTPDYEKYNCTTTTSFGYNAAIIGATQTFTVPALMSYKFKHVVAIVDPNNEGNYIEGIITAYSGTTLTIKIKNIKGTGNTSGWSVMLTAPDYLPYLGDPANSGKYFYNNNGVIEMRISGIFTGLTIPWHNPVIPAGFLSCNGQTFTQTSFPELFEHLRPSGGSTRYAYDITTNSALASGVARTPAYNVGAIPYGVDGSTILAGARFGSNSHTIANADLPVVSPWVLNDPGHAHTLADGNDTPSSGGGFAVTSNTSIGPNGATTDSHTTGITLNNNGTVQSALDMRQLSEGCIYIIKT